MSKFVISNKNGRIIHDLDSWHKAFVEVDSEKHWQEGRSAYALAHYFCNPLVDESLGLQKIKNVLSCCKLSDVVFEYAEIEHESRFDSFRGHGRMQDMTIWCHSKSTPIVVNIEAKVDEPFSNSYIPEAYAAAIDYVKNKPESKIKARMDNLIAEFFPGRELSDLNKIRYQLLYYLAGSIREAAKANAVAFLPVMVFHTSKYNNKVGLENKEDYFNFMNELQFDKVVCDKAILYSKTYNDIKVYSCYLEI